ncbi:MAG: DUF1552 domain-containing protein [Deltaproteobacteria bacterium]|nr:DUF1552 domain-containing protein [Deltaproteobacteria bacterium]
MKKIVISRRQILRGSAGMTLGLPFLPSLYPIKAYAANLVFASPPRFVAMTSMHGGVRESAMYPNEATANETLEVHPGHVVRRGNLKLANGGLSTVLTSPNLTDRLVSKMNVLRGLDIPFYIAHNTGMLGNFARNDGNGSEGQAVQAFPMPTIDQVMAWSPSFYKSLDGIKERSMVTHFLHSSVSWNYSNPSAQTGTIQAIRNAESPGDLFTRIFVPPTTGTTPPPPKRTPIINRVIQNYRSLRQSNRRLSAADKQRLDDHVSRLDELDRRVNTGSGNGGNLAACKDQKGPMSSSGAVARQAAFNDVFTAAFLCGTSRIAVIGTKEEDFVSVSGSWHQDFAHQWNSPAPQLKLQEANQKVFHHGFVDLIKKLDVEEAPGQSVLDNSLVIWTNECAEETHDSRSIPVIMAGSAGGFLKTGNYCDYRRKIGTGTRLFGLLYSQMLATCLQAVGVPAAEFQKIKNNGPAGYGYPRIDNTYVSGVKEKASDILPFLKASEA